MTVEELIRLLQKENPKMTVALPLWSSWSSNLSVKRQVMTRSANGWYNDVRTGDDSGRAHGVVLLDVRTPL
jgi:hypothetical protein